MFKIHGQEKVKQPKDEGLRIIGAKKRPDGTMDYSRAAIEDKSTKQESPAKPTPQELAKRKKELDEEWRKSEENQKQRAQADQANAAKQAEAIYKKIDIKSPTEREKERDKATEIVFQNGGIRANMSIREHLSEKGYSGFQNLQTRFQDYSDQVTLCNGMESQFFAKPGAHSSYEWENPTKGHGVKEIIDIRHVIKQAHETVVIPGKKGIFGIGKIPEQTVQRATGRHEPTLHSEIVNGGKDEPAVRFTYYIPQTHDWTDYTGRPGQRMTLEILLPESDAKKIEQILDRDPGAMRQIAEQIMKEKLLKDPGAWGTPQGKEYSLRPPYEKWDAEPNGGKIYIQKEGQKPGFHEDRLRKIQK